MLKRPYSLLIDMVFLSTHNICVGLEIRIFACLVRTLNLRPDVFIVRRVQAITLDYPTVGCKAEGMNSPNLQKKVYR